MERGTGRRVGGAWELRAGTARPDEDVGGHRGAWRDHQGGEPGIAVDETVILLHPPLPLVGVSIVMERERQQNDSLVNG